MSDVIVYDKPKWHYEHKDYPPDLPERQGAIYGGFFLAWLHERGLLSEEMLDDWEQEVQQLASKSATPADIYDRIGVLTSDMLTEEGNRIADLLFESKALDYYSIFAEELAAGLPTPYHVADSWTNYNRLRRVLDRVRSGSLRSSEKGAR